MSCKDNDPIYVQSILYAMLCKLGCCRTAGSGFNAFALASAAPCPGFQAKKSDTLTKGRSLFTIFLSRYCKSGSGTSFAARAEARD